VIGTIADDFTGATDVAAAFRREGLPTLLFFGVPAGQAPPVSAAAAVIALKSRAIPRDAAVSQSLGALDWLRGHGADQIYFKYCSTFDSTPHGNIGPVLDALSESLGGHSVLTTPSSPEHQRTQYLGYLFVGDRLLAESHMAHHPVNPMTDSSLRRLLSAQSANGVAVIEHASVRSGAERIRLDRSRAAESGSRYLLVDALDADDLRAIGRAALGDPLVAGAAGLASGLAAARAATTAALAVDPADSAAMLQAMTGPAAILAGSCSVATLRQLDVLLQRGHPEYRLDPTLDPDPASMAAGALDWFDVSVRPGRSLAPVIYSSLDPAGLRRAQAALGTRRSADLIEDATGRIAAGLMERGISRLIVAGGETAGTVVRALGTAGGVIGPEAAPGVPWIYAADRGIALLLKSGNFGGPDLLADASATPTSGRAARRAAR
jgi:3-dehydrotetronate 4-kinase